MPPFRNPFTRKPPPNGLYPTNDENAPPANGTTPKSPDLRSSLTASRTSSAVSIKQNKEPDEFKMSVVDDKGTYLPPSPPERKGFWQRTPTSTTTSSHRSMLSENEPFSISRESFESYRRSFDISARSPISHHDNTYGRQSLDSRGPRTPRSPFHSSRFDKSEPRVVDEEEPFEDVGLDDAKPKKRSLFSRFEHSNNESATNSEDSSRPGSSHGRFHLPGRKRGQSGQGAELRSMGQNPVVPKEAEEGAVR